MNVDRRKFVKIAGVSTMVGLAGKEATETLAQNNEQEPVGEHHRQAKRFAMVIDLKKCKCGDGCNKECILACHRKHNVPDFGNPKDEIKWIWTEDYEKTFPSQENEYVKEGLLHNKVPVLCNHCDNPPCVRVCPTKATWQRESGIVMMDWHRCIGCRYCIAACPYGSRSFNWRDPRGLDENNKPFIENINPEFPTRTRGVVEKCTLCNERLDKGLPPACVEACQEKAMVFGDLEDADSEVRELLRSNFSIRRKPELGTQPEIYYLV